MSEVVEESPAPKRIERRRKARFEPGKYISERYRVVSSWGAGRLDEAYQVEDLVRGERVVLKVLRRMKTPLRPSRELTRVFTRLSKLDHDNVARVFDLAVHAIPDPVRGDEWILFVTSELVKGETLGSFVRAARPLSPETASSLIDGVCSGLAAMHGKGVVHGNLSGAAIVVCEEGGSLRPVITDFEPPVSEPGSQMTSIGSPVYKAPETIIGRPPDEMSDVFSLGAVIYEILSGRIPFTGGNLLAIDFRRLEEEPRPLGEIVDSVDPRIEKVVTRCLNRGREDRYANAREVRQAIRGTDMWTPRTRRNVWTLSAAAALVAVMFGGSALLDRVAILEREPLPYLGGAVYRPSIAVLELSPTDADTEPWISTALSELIRQDFRQNGAVRVADIGLMREIAGFDTPQVGAPDREAVSKLRSLFDVETILTGTCTTVRSGNVPVIAIDICLLDARTGETLAAVFERGSPHGLSELAARAAERLRNTLGISTAASDARWDPDAVRPWAEGLHLANQQRLREALAYLEQAAALQPDNPFIQDALADVWSEIGFMTRATDHARRSVDLSRTEPTEQTLERRATLAALEGDLTGEIEFRGRLARSFPDRVSHEYRLIDTLIRAGGLKGAGEELGRVRTARATVDARTELLDARLAVHTGRFEEALVHAERAESIAEDVGSATLRGEAVIERAWAEAAMGNTSSAWSSLNEAEDILTATSNASDLAEIDSIRATILQRRGELDAAVEVYERLRDRFTSSGREAGYATAIGSQAIIRSLQGRHTAALTILEEAIEHFEVLEDNQNIVRSLALEGSAHLSLGHLDDAKWIYLEAASIAASQDLSVWEGFALIGIARTAIEKLDLKQAEKALKDASSIFRKIEVDELEARVDPVKSEIDRLRGNLDDAGGRLEERLTQPRGISDPENRAELQLALAAVRQSAGNDREALSLASQALAYYTSIGNVDRQADCLTVAFRASSRLGLDAESQVISDRVNRLIPELESEPRLLRIRLAFASSKGKAATAERLAVHARAVELGLRLVRAESAGALRDYASDPRERERWSSEVEALVETSGARFFLAP